MEMDEAQAVAHVLLVKKIQGFQEFCTCQTEFRGVTPTLFPFSGTRRSQFDTNTDIRPDVHLLGNLGNDIQLIELLYNDEDALAHLLGEQGQFYIALILITITNDDGITLALYSNHCVQLGFGASLYAQVELLSVRDNFLDYRLYLIDLDRIDNIILSLVVVFLSRFLKATPSLLNTIVQNIREAQQYRRRHITQGQFIHHFTQVYLRTVLAGGHIDITLLVDAEIGSSPTVDVVEFLRVVNGPFLHSVIGFSG